MKFSWLKGPYLSQLRRVPNRQKLLLEHDDQIPLTKKRLKRNHLRQKQNRHFQYFSNPVSSQTFFLNSTWNGPLASSSDKKTILKVPSGFSPCSRQYNSQQEFPIWTPACPTWIEITSRLNFNLQIQHNLKISNYHLYN